MAVELDDTQQAADPARTATLAATAAPLPSGTELAPGLQLGHFRIERKLGAGGMGEVYLASDLALDRPVAIKVLPAGTSSGAARERLIREARAQARIIHPNVAHIYFVGEDAGRLYFAMEYIVGKTLAETIAQTPLRVEDALAAIRAAALGLREAQRFGFMHRDIKPSNLMIDSNGLVKVLDFGLVAGGEHAIGSSVTQTSLAGTPLYMAPEQARGEPIDFRADVYALGATLYHLISGKPPYEADSVEELITLHATAVRPSLPRRSNQRTTIVAIDQLVTRMMAAKPEDRFASYDELLQAIELVSAQHTRPAGFWVRSIATTVDFGVVSLLFGLAHMPIFGNGDMSLAYALAIYAAYSILAIHRWGTTFGKALFELEVVATASGRRPSWRQLIERELALIGLPLVSSGVVRAFEAFGVSRWARNIAGIVVSVSLFLLFAALVRAVLRTPGKRAPWDRVSGTIVRYRTMRSTPAAGGV
jgi:serine/threonine protein kinase